MTSHSQLQAVQQEIDSVKAEIQQTKQDLAKAKADNDSKEVDFLRKRLEQLDKKENSLREQQTILLRAQAPGQHCLPCQNSLKLHTTVCAHHVGAHFPPYAVPSPLLGGRHFGSCYRCALWSNKSNKLRLQFAP